MIHGIGIPNVGKQAAKDLESSFKSMEHLQAAPYSELIQINGMGPLWQKVYVVGLMIPITKQCSSKLKAEGLNKETKTIKNREKKNLEDKYFVITGKFTGLNRDQLSEWIEQSGGKVSSSVSAKTDYLVAGESAGSKLVKAQKLGVAIISDQALKQLLQGGQ